MFIKRKTRVEKAYVYWMPMSFKTLVTDKNSLDFTPDSFVRHKAAFVGHNSENVWCPVYIYILNPLKLNFPKM